MSWKDAYNAGYRAAKRARIVIWLRPVFAWRVAIYWSRHGHAIEDAINSQLSRYMWKKITF